MWKDPNIIRVCLECHSYYSLYSHSSLRRVAVLGLSANCTVLAGSNGGSGGDPTLPPGVRTLLEFIAWVVFSHQQKLLSRQVHHS